MLPLVCHPDKRLNFVSLFRYRLGTLLGLAPVVNRTGVYLSVMSMTREGPLNTIAGGLWLWPIRVRIRTGELYDHSSGYTIYPTLAHNSISPSNLLPTSIKSTRFLASWLEERMFWMLLRKSQLSQGQKGQQSWFE